MKKITVVLAVLLLGLLVAGCVRLSQETSTQPNQTITAPMLTPLPITPIPPAMEPDWLTVLYPKPGQVVLLEDYLSSSHTSNSGGFASVPEVPSAICVDIWASQLFGEGDFWDMGDVTERTLVVVDGFQRQSEGMGFDGINLTTIEDSEGNVLGEVGGPYAFCFPALLGVGTHQVDLSFRKSFGMTPVYSWTFEIVLDAIPTSTPLPTPSAIDSQGNLPDYLQAVYPQPGQQLSLNEPEGDAIWRGLMYYQSLPEGHQNICFAFRESALHALGSLPSDSSEWPDRIYIQVDKQIQSRWNFPTNWDWEEDWGWVQLFCAPALLPPGEHIATIYIHPFDSNIVSYSWSFTLIE